MVLRSRRRETRPAVAVRHYERWCQARLVRELGDYTSAGLFRGEVFVVHEARDHHLHLSDHHCAGSAYAVCCRLPLRWRGGR